MHLARTFKRLALPIVAALLILTALWGWHAVRGGGSVQTFRTATPVRGEIVSTVTSSGTLNPVVTVTVGAPVSGIIKEIYVDFNSTVKKGQIIALIDPATFRAQVEQGLGNYLAALANADKAKVTLADANRTLGRYQSLVRNGSVSVSDYDNAATAAASAKAALAAAEGAVAQAKGAYDQARTNLEYASIRSPVDGIVISRAVDVGQTVAASFQTPTLFTIAQDLTKMQIYATVDEADIGKTHQGGEASFTVDAYPDARFSGVVTQVRNAAATVSNVVTYTVVVGVDNADLRLKPGMTATITFVAAKKDDALKIPTAALRFRPTAAEGEAQAKTKSAPGEKHVYVLQDGRPVSVAVTLGIANDKETEVLSGLGPDAVVVLEALGVQQKPTVASPLGQSGGPGMGPPPR